MVGVLLTVAVEAGLPGSGPKLSELLILYVVA